MSLRRALLFPFRNPAKVLTIALAQSLLIFSLVMVSHRSYRVQLPGDLAALVNVVVFVISLVDIIWLHGYAVAVLRSLIQDYYSPPAVDFFRNMREGVKLIAATLVYALPIFIGFAIVVIIFNNLGTPGTTGYNYDAMTVIFMTILFVHFATKFFARTVYDVGVARFAANGYSSSIVEIGTNASILRKNFRAFLSYELRQAVLLALYALLASSS